MKTEAFPLRILLISDIHGNLPALEKVIRHGSDKACDLRVCLGDITGYGPWPSQCIGLVRSFCHIVVAGNHDHGCAGILSLLRFNAWGESAVIWSRERLDETEKSWLAGLPLTASEHGLNFCHAVPGFPGSWKYILDRASALSSAERTPGETWFYGHTHLPCGWSRKGSVTRKPRIPLKRCSLVNCGSVGQPRDGDPRAAYMVVDPGKGTAETFRVPYPVEKTASEIRRAGLPVFLGERLFTGS